MLLAYSAAGILALLPLTPGGLGIVEASLSGLLVLAGVRASYAFLATLAYRVISYWLPLLAGLPAYVLFRNRYGRPVIRRAAPDGESQPSAGDAASPITPATVDDDVLKLRGPGRPDRRAAEGPRRLTARDAGVPTG